MKDFTEQLNKIELTENLQELFTKVAAIVGQDRTFNVNENFWNSVNGTGVYRKFSVSLFVPEYKYVWSSESNIVFQKEFNSHEELLSAVKEQLNKEQQESSVIVFPESLPQQKIIHTSTKKSKLASLVDICGFADTNELLETSMADSVVIGICTVPGCDYTVEVEPDCSDGYCESCGTNTVKSALVLADLI